MVLADQVINLRLADIEDFGRFSRCDGFGFRHQTPKKHPPAWKRVRGDKTPELISPGFTHKPTPLPRGAKAKMLACEIKIN
jgi:hypothetical protein